MFVGEEPDPRPALPADFSVWSDGARLAGRHRHARHGTTPKAAVADPLRALLIALFFVGWAASSALIGCWLGTPAFAFPIAAVVGAATVGQVLGKFDNELRALTWVIQPAFSAVLIALGIWLRNRRAPASPRS